MALAAIRAAEWSWTPPHPKELHTSDRLDADAQLVEGCLSGQEAAWEQLVRTHTRLVYSVCYRFTGSDSEAQDLTQEVFLRVFKNLKSFRAGEGRFAVWLGRLTRNLLIDHYRKTRMDRATESLEEQAAMLEQSRPGWEEPRECWQAAKPVNCCSRRSRSCLRSCGRP